MAKRKKIAPIEDIAPDMGPEIAPEMGPMGADAPLPADTAAEDAALAALSSAKQPEESRADEEFFRGGLPLDINRKMKDGRTLREHLEERVVADLRAAIEDHKPRLEKISKWEKMYRCEKGSKSYPYVGCANVAIPMVRIRADATLVNIYDIIWGRQKVWLAKAKDDPQFGDLARKCESLLDWWQKNCVKLQERAFSPLAQAVISGTGFAYMPYARKKRTVYGWGGQAFSPTVPTDATTPVTIKTAKGKVGGTKTTLTTFDGPDFIPVDRKDVVWSSDATCVEDAGLIGFRTRLTDGSINARIDQGHYLKDIKEKINKSDADDITQRRGTEKGVEVKPGEHQKYEVWQIWTRFDVDEDGYEDDIVLSIHEKSGTLCRGVYNEFFSGFRPLVPFVLYPLPFSLDGEGIAEILDKLQEEIDSVHNQRLDRMNQANHPSTILKASAGLDNFTRAPGTVHFTHDDPSQVAYEFKPTDVNPSTWPEENQLNGYADQASGISPAVMGMSTAERPVAKETFALLQQANKKFAFGGKNIRRALNRVAEIAIDEFSQYAPTYSYYDTESGQLTRKEIAFPYSRVRDAVDIDVAASDEMWSQEARRESNITVYQMVKDYNTGLAQVLQLLANPQVPPPAKMVMVQMGVGAARMFRETLRDFNRPDADELVVDLSQFPEIQQLLMPPPPPPPMPGQGGPEQGPGGPEQGGPPQGGGPQGPPPGPPGPPPQGPPPGMGGM